MSKEHNQNILLHQSPCLAEEEHSFGHSFTEKLPSTFGLVAGLIPQQTLTLN